MPGGVVAQSAQPHVGSRDRARNTRITSARTNKGIMLLQTNSYIVPKDKRAEHARLLQRFRQTLLRLGFEHFEAYEQVRANWSGSGTTGRVLQLMSFQDRKQPQ